MPSLSRPTLRAFAAAAAAALLCLGSLAGCGGDDDSPEDPGASEVFEAPTDTPVSETPTAGPPAASGSSSAPPAGPGASTTRSTGAPTKSSSKFPPAVEPEQGGKYWAAIVSVSESLDDPLFAEVEESLRQVGYDVDNAASGLSCFDGALDFVKLEPTEGEYYGIALMFKTEQEARQFDKAYGGDLAGVGQVTTYCLD